MGNTYSSSPPEPAPMMDNPGYPMPDFNNIFHKGVPKMMQVTDDLHRMTDYIMDLRNMMIGLALLSIVGVLMFLILKWNNGRRTNRGRKRLNEYSSEHSSLSRPYRTYPQKSVDWTLHHHNMNMEKLLDHSGNNSPPHNKIEFQHEPGTNANIPNGNMGNMQKVSDLIDLEKCV
uniref:Uncharacterized protein n=1 Tax=Panagrolaimus superbus TaxID=310955 RepID=A0A914YP83_9BILA